MPAAPADSGNPLCVAGVFQLNLQKFSSICLITVLLLGVPFAHASETPAEHAANRAAAQEMAAAPAHGNLPDYSLSPDKLLRAQHISAFRVRAYFCSAIWGIAQIILLLSFGIIAWMRDTALRAGGPLHARGRWRLARWLEGLIFISLFLFATTLLNLPINMYLHHFSASNGFSVQGWPGWFGDLGKSLALILIGGWLAIMLLYLFIRMSPRRWWLVFWPIAVAFMLLGTYGAPLFYDPLFHHFEPLTVKHAALAARLEEVARRGHMNIPVERMKLMDASTKTRTVNAYVTGFGNSKQLVLWDTIIDKATPDELVFIFGHESGHYVLDHIIIGIAEGIFGLLLLLFVGYHFMQWSLTRFGARWRVPSQDDWGSLAVLLLAFSLVDFAAMPLVNAITRSYEHAADVYGQEAVHDVVADPQTTARDAMAVLGANYLEEPNVPALQEFWLDSHPSTGRRAAFAAHYNPWVPGFAPKYFPKDPPQK